MLVELAVVEQRYRAVLEVLEGATVTEVAARYGVARQTVHRWLRRYALNGGLGALTDRSSKPTSCPHQMPALLEAQIVALRRAHPGWGPATILWQLERAGVRPLPGRSSIYRTLKRHGLVTAKARRRKREDYRRWERARAMELWQMDVMGRAFLTDGTELKVVTGIDDHSRFVVCARLVRRATAGPVCQALQGALATHGAPLQLLTDNGKVFTSRFGLGPGPVLFDRICASHDIKHLLTAPYSPTTTGKVERLHKTIRTEFLTEHDRKHDTLEQLQTALDEWVEHYNTARPHQSCGGRPPAERFALADRTLRSVTPEPGDSAPAPAAPQGSVSRRVNPDGRISLTGISYPVGPTFAGEQVQLVTDRGLVQIFHRGVLVATRAQRFQPDRGAALGRSRIPSRARDLSTGLTVARLADSDGTISFAGHPYPCGKAFAHLRVQVTILANAVQLVVDGQVVRVHPISHDRSKEAASFARPLGSRPRARTG